MRTTINLPDALAERAKARAHEEGRTFTSLVEEGLRTVLDADSQPAGPLPPLPTSGTGHGRFLVDLEDKDAVWDILESDGWK